MRHDLTAYWSVIPAPVLRDPELTASAVLLYAEISTLCMEDGYCRETNEQLAKRMDLSVSQVSRLVAQLTRRGYLSSGMTPTETGRERHIYAGIFPAAQETDDLTPDPAPGGYTQKCADPPGGYTQKCADPPGGVRKNAQTHVGGSSKSTYYVDVDTIEKKKENKKEKRKEAPRARRGASVPQWRPEAFERFWAYYRHNVRGEDRMAAVREWDRLQPDDDTLRAIARALQWQVRRWRANGGIGMPYACRYLSHRRWEDVPPEADPAPGDNGPAVVEGRDLPVWT